MTFKDTIKKNIKEIIELSDDKVENEKEENEILNITIRTRSGNFEYQIILKEYGDFRINKIYNDRINKIYQLKNEQYYAGEFNEPVNASKQKIKEIIDEIKYEAKNTNKKTKNLEKEIILKVDKIISNQVEPCAEPDYDTEEIIHMFYDEGEVTIAEKLDEELSKDKYDIKDKKIHHYWEELPIAIREEINGAISNINYMSNYIENRKVYIEEDKFSIHKMKTKEYTKIVLESKEKDFNLLSLNTKTGIERCKNISGFNQIEVLKKINSILDSVLPPQIKLPRPKGTGYS